MDINNISKPEDMIDAINYFAYYLSGYASMIKHIMLSDGTTSIVYKMDNRYITVKRDVNDKAYSITFMLDELKTLDGYIIEGLIATNMGDIPF